MNVVVTEYSDNWEGQFSEESRKIIDIFGNELIAIHHIGSTSVRGLQAKPIIDIMPVVKDIRKVETFHERMRDIGYECMGEFGMSGRRFFRKGGDRRTHHVHIFQADNEENISRHLAVRDYLRSHPDEAIRYGELKESLAKRFPEDIEAYMDGKDAFVKELERKALNWYGTFKESLE